MTMTSFDTIWPADSVEFCPQEGATNVFVCGTYKLDQADAPDAGVDENTERRKQHRRGKCLPFIGENDELGSL